MKQSTSFAQMANNQSISLSSALRANTPPTKGQTTSRKFLTLSIFLLLSFFTTNAWGADYTLVTSNTNLNNGDKVIIATKNSSGKPNTGVTGQNGKKDATVSTTESEWVQYIVGSASTSGWTLYDSGQDKYIAKPTDNHFQYGTTAGTCFVNNNGVLGCNSRYLQANGTNYRMYSGINQSYTPFYVWKVSASYTVTATSNNNTYGTVSVSGTTITASPKTGYTYANPAYTVTYGSATVSQDGNTFSVTPSSNCTITINFEAIPKYTVTLNAGPGTCDASVTEASAGAGVTLPTPTLSSACQSKDWSFAGWAEESIDAETTDEPTLIPAGTYKPTSNITLYAVYSKEETIQGGGSEETKTVTLSTPTTTSGYKAGTKTDSEGNTWSYYAAINNQSGTFEFGLNSNALNYNIGSPIFDGKVSSVSFKARNGSSSESRKFLFCSTNTNAQPTTGDLAEVSIPKSQQFTNVYTADLSQSNISQFYIYAPKALGITTISVTYITTGGGSSSTTYYHSTPDCGDPCEKLGAATDLNVETNYVQDGQTYVKFSWTPAASSIEGTTQELCYGLVGQEKTCTESAKHLGEAKGVASNLPAGEYEWSIQALGDGNNYCDGDKVNGTHFYIYSITYNTNGGNTIAATSGTTLPDPLPTPTREHYNFEGWYTDEGCTQKATAGAKITQNTTLYAKWSHVVYTVTYDNGAGTGVGSTNTAGSFNLPSATPPTTCDAEGWTFAGWTTGSSVSETTTTPDPLYAAGSSYTPTSNITLYAVYSYTEAGGGEELSQTLKYDTWSYSGSTTDKSDYRLFHSSSYIESAEFDLSTLLKVVVYGGTFGGDKYNSLTIGDGTNTWKSVTVSGSSQTAANTYTDGTTLSGMGRLRVTSNSGTSDDSGVRISKVEIYTIGSTTVYNSNPTCLVPVWEGATIDKTALTVNCGGRSPMTGDNGAAKITFSAEKIYNFTKDITIEATTGFLVSTSQSVDANYQSSVSLSPLVGTTNANTFNDKFVYVRAEAPAQSDTDLEGTITIKNNKGETLQTFSVTADVTCTQYTLTLVDRGVSTEQPTKYYAGETIDEAPADPTGVCTDPIHYEFDGWATSTVAGGSTTYTKVSFPYTMPAKATTLYAVYRYTEGNTDSDKFMSVDKEIGELVNGMDYVLTGYNTYDGKEYALSCTQYESGKYKTKQIDVSESTTMYDEENPYYELTTTDNEIIWTITGDDENGYSFQNKSTGKYLNMEESSLVLNDNNPTKYTIEHYVGYDSELGKYVQYLNVIIQPLEDYSYYLSSYYKNSTAGVLFNLHSSSTLQLYLYKRAAATLYTTSPACGPMLEITSGKDIYVTSGYGTGRNTVIAQQTVEYRATRLKTQNGSAEGKAPDVKVAANGITIGGEVTDKVKVVELTQNKVLIEDKYTITGTVTVQYTPTANNLQEEIQVQLAVDYNSEAKDNFTVHARSLPAEFVIAAKQGEQWYALNADMSGSDAEKANNYLQVDNIEDPTKATFAPCNTIYTFDGMVDGGNKEYMRFQGIEGKYLWAASEGNTGIQNYAKNTPTAVTTLYNWQLYTNDNETYQLQNEGNGRKLGLNKDLSFGMYSPVSTLQQDIRILPIEAKCIYNYAPTNLKVSVLKSTYVTLTWEPVVGATKYQYSIDAINWIDAGSEPTVTITNLSSTTQYTYYVRAYHEDVDITQECIDYAEISFATANCDDVPADIYYSSDLTTITVGWTAQSSTTTLKLYSDKEAENIVAEIDNNTSNPYTFTGLTRNTTYYVQVFANGNCASPIVEVSTKPVELDIVEWDTDKIFVDINTNERVSVTLENEVSYGSGTGKKAEELFFSKYFEATGNVKLLALYNGTNQDIDLTQYSIKFSNKGKDITGITDVPYESTVLLSEDIPADRRTLKAGQELIMISYSNVGNDDKVEITNPDGTTSYVSPSDYEVLACAAENKKESGWDKYVRVTSPALNFSGNDAIALFKNGELIDIIGAGNRNYADMSNVVGKTANNTFMDAAGWYSANGYQITLDNTIGTTQNYALSTNRCLLIRRNDVVSGEDAVTQNTEDFVTLGGQYCEWMGYQIPNKDEACNGFMYVGKYDYSKYYTKFESMGDDLVFDTNSRNPDGTITVPISGLNKQSCRNIKITVKDEVGNVLKSQDYKVPIMITTNQKTAYTDADKAQNAFYALQENLATVEVDGSGNPTGNKTNLTLAQVQEICKTCDVVVRDNATLTKATDGENDHPQVRDVYVYEGASLNIPNGDNYNFTINSLSLRRKGDVVASASVQGTEELTLQKGDISIYLDLRVDANNWHWFTLPYNCLIEDVAWVDGTPAKYNTDWFLMYYDGESRAASTNPYDNHWRVYNGTTIEAGKGYIVGITGDLTHPNYTFELRFPMAQGVLTAEQTDKTVPVNAWGVKLDNTPNNLGWNLVGNPYLNYYKTADGYSLAGLPLIHYIDTDPVTGEWNYENSGSVPYVATPIDGGWYEYQQELASEVNLMPFTAYFVQVGDPNTHENGQALNASFKASNQGKKSIVRRAPREVEEIEEPIIVRVELTNSKGESDKTSLVIDDRFTNEYEMNGDFFKWFGDYYNYYTKPVLYTIGADQGKRAFNALNEELAKQPIPMGMYAAQAGNYTFSLNQQFDLSRVEEVWLYDATQSTYTNLMQSDYTFSTSKVNGAGRFSLSVKLAPKVATSIDNVTADKVWATTHTKQVLVNGLESGMHLWLYDATGKLLYTEPTSNYQHTYAVPQTGTYFVSVMKGNAKQTIKVVVE